MRDVENCRAKLPLDALELETHFGTQFGVERGQRLVHQIDGGLAYQCAADRDPLHFAAGQRGSAIGELLPDMQQLGHVLDAAADEGLIHATCRRAQGKGEIVVHGQMWIQRVLLEHEGDVALGRHLPGDVPAADHHAAMIGPLQPCDQPQCGGLAGAGRSKQHDEFAVSNRERKTAHCIHRAKALADINERDISHGALPHPAPRTTLRRLSCRTARAYPAVISARPSRRRAPPCLTAGAPSPGRWPT